MISEQFQTHSRNITDSQFGDNITINQGNVHHHYPSELPQPRKPIRLIPYLRNREFVDRPGPVEKLNALLPQDSQSFNNAALWGLGGSGKTQIALELAYRQSENPQCSVFWVHADTRAAFVQGYKKIAASFGLAEIGDGQESELLRAVSSHIQSESEWLLVIDNADDLSIFGVGETQQGSSSLFDFVPNGTAVETKGAVLWTSRDGQIAGSLLHPSRRAIHIPHMTSVEARNLLAIARGVNCEDGQEQKQDGRNEDEDIEKLLEELQKLPLGISQAGAYMRRAETSVREYLAMLSSNEERWPLLEEEQFDMYRKAGVPNSILKIWSISVARIAQENFLASNILGIMAYFDNRDMPYDMIDTTARLSTTASLTSVEVQRAVIRLREFSFIRPRDGEKGSQSYEMHKLVQEATRYTISAAKWPMYQGDDDAKWSTSCFARVAVHVVDILISNPPMEHSIQEQLEGLVASKGLLDFLKRGEKYFAHVVNVVDRAEVPDEERRMCALLYRVSTSLRAAKRWKDKESVDGRILTLRSRLFGPNHVATIRSEQPIAESLCKQGRYSEAEQVETRVLEKLKGCLGEQHLYTLQSMHHVADIMCKMLRFEPAEELQAHALQLLESAPGPSPRKLTIDSLHCLARAYYGQRKFDQVGQVCTKSLIYCRDQLEGATYYLCSEAAIRTIGFRVQTLVVQGHLRSEATAAVESLVSEICDKIQRQTHLHEVTRMEMLVRVNSAAGKDSEAVDMQVKVVDFYRKTLGENCQKTMVAMECLAGLYHMLGRCDEAEQLLVKVVSFFQETVGKEHPYTLANMVSLAAVYRGQGRFEESKQVQDKVLPVYTKSLGRPFPLSYIPSIHQSNLPLGFLVDVNSEAGIMRKEYAEAMVRQIRLQLSSGFSAVPIAIRLWIGQFIWISKLVMRSEYRRLHTFDGYFPFIVLFLSWARLYIEIGRNKAESIPDS